MKQIFYISIFLLLTNFCYAQSIIQRNAAKDITANKVKNSTNGSVSQKRNNNKPYRKSSANRGNDMMQGYATVSTPDGGTYEGNFVNGLFCGKGKYTFSDGSYIEGEFADCAPNGECTYVGSNGATIYQGNLKDWAIEGEGMLAWGDSTVVVGDWKNNGNDATNATLVTLNGEKLFQGPVVNGKFIRGINYGSSAFPVGRIGR